MNTLYKTFLLPTIISTILLVGVYLYFGLGAFITALLLVILEVTLSFDNAVVNAKVLGEMSPVWQQRFLTWGILFAVVGTRVILPILIVSLSVGLSPWAVTLLAVYSPVEYGHLLEGAHHAISAFGGIFLLMVALKYFFNDTKKVHWIRYIERNVARWGNIEAIEIGISLALLAVIALLSPDEAATILLAGVSGMITFIAIQGLSNTVAVKHSSPSSVAASGLTMFLYLNVLDASFSLDGVIGAFAITSVLPIIIIGLGIGAYFVRSLTVYLVRQKTLDTLVYIEHGAHWAILGLAGSMLLSLFIHVSEVIVGLIGITFVLSAFYSSYNVLRSSRAKAVPTAY